MKPRSFVNELIETHLILVRRQKSANLRGRSKGRRPAICRQSLFMLRPDHSMLKGIQRRTAVGVIDENRNPQQVTHALQAWNKHAHEICGGVRRRSVVNAVSGCVSAGDHFAQPEICTHLSVEVHE
jgi:hypothetical protein